MVTTTPTPTVTTTRPEPTVVMVPNNLGFAIAADRIRTAIEDLPDDQRELVWWFSQWCRKNNLNRKDLGQILRKPGTQEYYSHDSITQLFTGGRIRRGENIEPMIQAIQQLRSVESVREEQANSGFIETRLAREIARRCRKALTRQRIMFIFGESQIGKTEALKEYQKNNNHGETIYMEMPSGGSLTGFIHSLCEIFNIPSKQGAKAGLRDRLIKCFNSRMLLIVDEAHRALKPGSIQGLDTWSFIREIWNKSRCGIVISLTNEGRDQLTKGPNAKALSQIWKRRITPLQLPDFPPDDDAALFAMAYGLPPATEKPITVEVAYIDEHGAERTKKHTDIPLALQRNILRAEGLGVWIGILQDAADMATEQRRAITWGAVIKAACQSTAESEVLL